MSFVRRIRKVAGVSCFLAFATSCGEQLAATLPAAYDVFIPSTVVTGRVSVFGVGGNLLGIRDVSTDMSPGHLPNLVAIRTLGIDMHDTTYSFSEPRAGVVEFLHADTVLVRAVQVGDGVTADFFLHGTRVANVTAHGNWAAISQANTVEEPECDPEEYACEGDGEWGGNFWQCLSLGSQLVSIGAVIGLGASAAIDFLTAWEAAAGIASTAKGVYTALIGSGGAAEEAALADWIAKKALVTPYITTFYQWLAGIGAAGILAAKTAVQGVIDLVHDYVALRCWPVGTWDQTLVYVLEVLLDHLDVFDPDLGF